MTITLTDRDERTVSHRVKIVAGDPYDGIGHTADGRAVTIVQGDAWVRTPGSEHLDDAGCAWRVVRDGDRNVWRVE